MKTMQYVRKSFAVEAIQVTDANMSEVAKWCDGDVTSEMEEGKRVTFIKVRVHTPMSDRQTKAYVSDWVLFAGRGYKVYTDKAFRKSFDAAPEQNLRIETGGGGGSNVFASSTGFSGGGGAGGSANPGGTAHRR